MPGVRAPVVAVAEVAWLVWDDQATADRGGAWSHRRPAAVRVLDDVLAQAGITPALCSARTAHEHQVVLVTLGGLRDVARLRAVTDGLDTWQAPRAFTVIAGGYGAQNPHPLRHTVDALHFGRGEARIVDLVQAALDGRPLEGPGTMPLPDLVPVDVLQAERLFAGEAWVEESVGCPLTCRFCHYTFARKHQGGDHAYSPDIASVAGQYVADGHAPAASIEITWPQLLTWPHDKRPSRITVAIDGASERLRRLYGKRISDAEITEGLTAHAARAATWGRSTSLTVYDIAFPAETAADREQLAAALAAVEAPPGNLFAVNLHVTPFHASPWTPMAWEPFMLEDVRGPYAGQMIAHYHGPTAYQRERRGEPWGAAQYRTSIMSRSSVAAEAVVIRHDGSPDAEAMLRAVCSPRWRRTRDDVRLAALRRTWPEAYQRATGRRELDEDLPADLARGVASLDTLRTIAQRMRDEEAGPDRPMGRTLAQRLDHQRRRTIPVAAVA